MLRKMVVEKTQKIGESRSKLGDTKTKFRPSFPELQEAQELHIMST